jgi:hypothetical protein
MLGPDLGDASESLEEEAADHQSAAEEGVSDDAGGGGLLLVDEGEAGEAFVEVLADAVSGEVAEAAKGLLGEGEGSDECDGVGGEAEAETVSDEKVHGGNLRDYRLRRW